MASPRAVFILLSSSLLAAGGCKLSHSYLDLPQGNGPSRELVLNAAREVIQERYPMSYTSEEGGHVYAKAPVVLDGAQRTHKKISVFVTQNHTGAYEPVVRVRHYTDVATPELAIDTGGVPVGRASAWSPFAEERWVAMGFLPYEEQEVTDAILRRLSGAGLPPPTPTGP